MRKMRLFFWISTIGLVSGLLGSGGAASGSKTVTEPPLFEVVSPEGREIVPLPPAEDGGERYMIKMETIHLPGDHPASLIPGPTNAGGLPPETLWTRYVIVGKPLVGVPPDVLAREAADRPTSYTPAQQEEMLGRQAPGTSGWDHVGVQAETSGCDGYYWYAPWICEYPWDNTHAQGSSAAMTFVQTSLNGDLHTAMWTGLVTSSGTFAQVGYTRGTDLLGNDAAFVQAYQAGHYTDSCNNGYTYCNAWIPSPSYTVGDRYHFYLKSGYGGNANSWGFYQGPNLLVSLNLGASDSGGNAPMSYIERHGSAHNAYLPQTYWDCGLCLWQSGDVSWHGAAHATYEKSGVTQCPGMAEFKELYGAEFWLGDGSNGTVCPADGTRVW